MQLLREEEHCFGRLCGAGGVSGVCEKGNALLKIKPPALRAMLFSMNGLPAVLIPDGFIRFFMASETSAVQRNTVHEGFECYLLVSPISYSLSLSSSKISTSSLPVVERLVFLLMLSLASVIAKRSPLLHSIGSSRMAAEKHREVKWIVRKKKKRKDKK